MGSKEIAVGGRFLISAMYLVSGRGPDRFEESKVIH